LYGPNLVARQQLRHKFGEKTIAPELSNEISVSAVREMAVYNSNNTVYRAYEILIKIYFDKPLA